MKTMFRAAVTFLATFAACSIAHSEPAPPIDMMRPPVKSVTPATIDQVKRLLGDMQAGGYVIAMRHASTDRTEKDTDPAHPGNCAAERGLTGLGRLNAYGWAGIFKNQQLPVAAVYSSLYCRCTETAELLSLGPVNASLDYTVTSDEAEAEKVRRAAQLKALLTQLRAGTNVVVVTHLPNIIAAFGAQYADLDEGDAIAVKTTVDGQVVVGRLPLVEVAAFTRAYRVAAATKATP